MRPWQSIPPTLPRCRYWLAWSRTCLTSCRLTHNRSSPNTGASLRRRAARRGGWAVLAGWVWVPIMLTMKVELRYGLPFLILVSLLTAHVWWGARSGSYSRVGILTTAVLMQLTAASASVLFGSLVMVPAMAVGFALALVVNTRADQVTRFFIVLSGLAATTVPLVLGLLGVLPLPYSFAETGHSPFNPGGLRSALVRAWPRSGSSPVSYWHWE